MPALTRSRKMLRSNSAKTASIPARARPLGVVRSSASLSETKPTSSGASSCRVETRSTSERPQRVEPPHDDLVELPPTGRLKKFLSFGPQAHTRANILDFQGNSPATLGDVIAHLSQLQRERLLVMPRDPGAQPGSHDLAWPKTLPEWAVENPDFGNFLTLVVDLASRSPDFYYSIPTVTIFAELSIVSGK